MQVSNAIKIWLDYHKSHSRDNTIKAYPATQLATKTDISSIHLSGGIVRISQNCKAMIFT